MKKIYQIIMLCAMGITLAGCGGSSSSTKAEDNSEVNYEDSVNIALENRDFVKAYQFASKCDMTKTVVSKEAAYVLEEQGETGLVRIAMIVNEHKNPRIYLDLLKMAISMGNEQLATKLYKMSDTCDEQAMDYAVTADMEGLVKTFLDKDNDYIEKQNVIEYLKEKGSYERIRSAILASKKEAIEKDLKDRETRLLRREIPRIIAPRKETKMLGNDDTDEQCEAYNKIVKRYNEECIQLLIDAIEYKNLRIAKRVAKMVKKTVEYSETLVKDNGRARYYDVYKITVTHSSESVNNAQQILNEAIRNGNFR